MTITGIENNYYLAGNDIWIQVSDFPKVPIRLELKVTNLITSKTMPIFRLYADLNNVFRFNLSQTIRPLQPYPDHNNVNTLQTYRLEFVVIFGDNTTEASTVDKYFIRGGRDKNNISEWYLSDGYPLIIGKWVEWRGVNLPGFAKKIMSSLVVDFIPSEAQTYRMINHNFCNSKIIKFRNSLGGYQFWVFESWEIKKKAKPKKSIGRYTTRLRQNRSKTIGLTSDVSLTLKTKTPIDCQAIINDMIDSPDVLMYDPAGDDTDSRWHRLELDSNDAVLNNADRVYLNEISFNMPNYINRDL